MVTIDATLISQCFNILILFSVFILIIYLVNYWKNNSEKNQEEIKKTTKKNNFINIYFLLNGRLSLKEYWIYWNIPFRSILILFYILDRQDVQVNSNIFALMNTSIIWPIFATTVKRLHDLNKIQPVVRADKYHWRQSLPLKV